VPPGSSRASNSPAAYDATAVTAKRAQGFRRTG
jgi:hypothetical protein